MAANLLPPMSPPRSLSCTAERGDFAMRAVTVPIQERHRKE
jgi:hypothetical protein